MATEETLPENILHHSMLTSLAKERIFKKKNNPVFYAIYYMALITCQALVLAHCTLTNLFPTDKLVR